jgi:hypothetical protein
MSRRLIVAAGTAAVALVIAVAVTTTAAATPTGVHGLAQRIETTHTSAAASTTTELRATCHDDEILTGGGYQVGSIGFNDKIFVNAPLDSNTWLVEMVNDTAFDIDLWAYAVCVG